MGLFSARRLVGALALTGALATAVAVPGVANAEPGGEQCSGSNIEGKGASLQKLAQVSIWTPAFNTSANARACNGTQGSTGKPTVTYTSTGSGAFLRSWGQETKEAKELNFGPKNAYGGTDEPPNVKQKEEIESHSTKFEAGKSKLLQTIPVMQAAVTISVHLPKGCKVEGGPIPGRLGLKETSLEKFFRGEITAWSKLLNKAKLVKSGTEACESTAPISRVVRKDGSGTTSLFKKYLNLIYKKGTEGEGTKTWKELAESANNTAWPKEAEHPVIRGEGNGGVATEVAKNASSIGYVNLADARSNAKFIPPEGGAGQATFWVEIENGHITEEGKKVATYADPADNGEEAAKGNSNCSETLYTNGKKKFPPESTNASWFEVTSSKVEPHYVICGFTYDLGLEKMGTFTVGLPETAEAITEGQVRSAFDYINFVLATGAGGGQKLIEENSDYLGLPTATEAKENVLLIAQTGVKRLGF
jgi:ABC-type phosphate transport system substrate-binding protein